MRLFLLKLVVGEPVALSAVHSWSQPATLTAVSLRVDNANSYLCITM